MPTLLEIFKDELKDVPNVLNQPKMKNYFKGQKRKIGTLLKKHYFIQKITPTGKKPFYIQDRNFNNLELMIYAEGDLSDFSEIKFVDNKGFASWDIFNKQIHKLVTTWKGIDRIDLRYPEGEDDWNQFTIWEKARILKTIK